MARKEEIRERALPRKRIVTLSNHHAYKLGDGYYKECAGIMKIFCKVKSKTYGVRDEYRVSGQATQVLLDHIIPKVKMDYLYLFF